MYRKINLANSQTRSKTTLIGLFSSDKKLPQYYATLDNQFVGQLAQTLKQPDFSTEMGKITTIHPKPNHTLLILGLGEKSKCTADTLRLVAALAVKQLDAMKQPVATFTLADALKGTLTPEITGHALAEGLTLGNFNFDQFKNADKPLPALKITVEAPMRKSFAKGLSHGEAANHARTLAATPPNVANPRWLTNYCRKLARDIPNLRCSVIDYKKAQQLKMGGLTAVGQGSNAKPALICLEYKPRTNSAGKTSGGKGPVMLVGKAVTFDTGGYSLKPTSSMLGMKYDKCGGMAVIATLAAAAKLKVNTHVVGLIPAAENMVDSDAYRPSDILKMYNGVTVEVTNTDAEGRLILGDALAWGYKKYQPAAVVDIATLTGGVNYALGSWAAGLFCNDEKFLKKITAASEASGERLWQLPLWDEHRDTFKGNHSDIVNSAGKGAASSSMGAAFLSYFIDKDSPRQMPTLPWIHLDVASTATTDSDGPIFAKGATGFGVRLMLRLVEDWK